MVKKKGAKKKPVSKKKEHKKRKTKIVVDGVPAGYKIISVIYYIEFALLLLLGLVAIVGGFIGGSTIPIPGLAGVAAAFFVGIGIFLIILSALWFFIAKSLWKGKFWAAIVAFIISIFGIIGSVPGMISGSVAGNTLYLIINIAIFIYLANRIFFYRA